MENSKNTGKLIGALLIGAAVGGILGILFAPDKGSETRKKIAGKTNDLTNSLKTKFNSLMGEARSEMKAAKERTAEVVGNDGAV